MLTRDREAEVHILAHAGRGKCGREIEIDQSRRLVAREGGTDDAAIQELQESMARDPGLLGEQRHLDHTFIDHRQHQVDGDLAHSRFFIRTRVGGRSWRDTQEKGLNFVVRLLRPRNHAGELTRANAFRVTADRSGEELHADRFEP